MKNRLVYILLTSILLLTSRAGAAASEGDAYVGVQYGVAAYDEDGISEEFNPTAAIVRLGRYFTPNIAIEARLGTGVSDDTRFLPELGSGYDATVEVDRVFGLYATAHANLTDSLSLYGVLGASKVKATATLPAFPGLKSEEDNSSVSYGVGADVDISSNLTLNLEAIRYLDKSEFNLDTLAVGVTFGF